MSKPLYQAYYRVNKETKEKEYLSINMFATPPIEWVPQVEKADKYSNYDTFLNNAKVFNLEIETDKYDYDFEEVGR